MMNVDPYNAEPKFCEAVPIVRSMLGDEHQKVLTLSSNWGTCLRMIGQYDAARDLLTRVHAAYTRKFGEGDLRTCITAGDPGKENHFDGKGPSSVSDTRTRTFTAGLDKRWKRGIHHVGRAARRLSGPDHEAR